MSQCDRNQTALIDLIISIISTSEDNGCALPLGGRSHVLLAEMCCEQQIARDRYTLYRQHPLLSIRTSSTHGGCSTHGSFSSTLQFIVTLFAAAAAASKVQVSRRSAQLPSACFGNAVMLAAACECCWCSACADNHMLALDIVKAKLVSCMDVGRSPLHVIHTMY